jgi:hypothetical protein
MLHGRHEQQRQLDERIGALRHGQSRALVIGGETGIGTTALLRGLIERARPLPSTTAPRCSGSTVCVRDASSGALLDRSGSTS